MIPSDRLRNKIFAIIVILGHRFLPLEIDNTEIKLSICFVLIYDFTGVYFLTGKLKYNI